MIIVLTLGRSGSSLIMQTLDLLGCTVIGRKFDQHDDPDLAQRHRDLNPGGYFEEPDIYYGGLAAETFQAQLTNPQPGAACKMDVRHFSDPAQHNLWAKAAPSIQAIIISYRHPAEQAHSEYRASALPNEDPSDRAKFLFLTDFLKSYTSAYGAIGEVPARDDLGLAKKIHLIEHSEARDAGAFVDRLRDIAGLASRPSERAKAVSNISADRVQTKLAALDDQESEWARNLGAMAVFEQLSQMRDRGSNSE